MASNTHLKSSAVETIANAEFRQAWPIEVRKALVRATKQEGEFPAYADKHVRWALAQARDIERRMARDIEVGEKSLSHAERKRLAAAR